MWMANETSIGKLIHKHDDGTLDIVIYARSGTKIGRVSPPEGGPRGFEPCCGPDGWAYIVKPNFPLTKFAFIEEIVFKIDREIAVLVDGASVKKVSEDVVNISITTTSGAIGKLNLRQFCSYICQKADAEDAQIINLNLTDGDFVLDRLEGQGDVSRFLTPLGNP